MTKTPFNRHLRRSRRDWTPEQDAALIALCGGPAALITAKLNALDWPAIAGRLEGKAPFGCRQRAYRLRMWLRDGKPLARPRDGPPAKRRRKTPRVVVTWEGPIQERPFIMPIPVEKRMARRA